MPAPLALLVLKAHDLGQYDDILAFHPMLAPLSLVLGLRTLSHRGRPRCQTIFLRSEEKSHNTT